MKQPRDGGMSAGKTSFFPRNFSPGGGGLLFKLVAVHFARGFFFRPPEADNRPGEIEILARGWLFS